MPRILPIRSTEDFTLTLYVDVVRGGLLRGTISRGLELLQILLLKIKDHADMVFIMQKQITWLQCVSREGEILGETAQNERRQRYASHRDLMQERREPLPFQGYLQIS